MKKYFLFCLLLTGLAAITYGQDCTSQINTSATLLGFNPNPLPTASGGVDYDHVNTIVLPHFVDNSLTPTPGDSIPLCGVRIESVVIDTIFSTPFPSSFNYTWEVWQNNDSLGIGGVIVIDTAAPVTRACLRIKALNPPQPLSTQDVIVIMIGVRGMIDLDGSGSAPCSDVPGSQGEQSYQITFLLEPSLAGINALPLTGKLVLYPNPAAEQLMLLPPAGNAPQLLIQIMDMQGRMVYEKNMPHQPAVQISLDGFAPGLYECRVWNGKEIFSQKFVKQ